MAAPQHKTRGETVVFDLLTSALAWGWPVLLAFVVTPAIVKGLGGDLYGIRGLIVSVTGYFALLDLGLNGAVTKYLAEYRAKGDPGLVRELLGTTLTTYACLGVVGGTLIWLLSGWFSEVLFSIPAQYHAEALWAFRLTGIGFALNMLTWWASAVPTGLQRFDVFNGISIGFGTLTLLGNLGAVYFGYGIVGVVVSNIFSNLAALLAYLYSARRLLPGIHIHFSFDKKMFRRTVMFGIYMVGFKLFAILFSQVDTLMIGAWLGTAAVTLYVVPQQAAQVVHGINGKMLQIVYPMASEFSAVGDKARMYRLFVRGFNLSVIIGLAAAVPLFVVAEPLLRYWISPEMALSATLPLQFLIGAFFLAGLTAIPVNVLSGANFPQFVTGGALVSGVCGVICYYLLIGPFGVAGVAAGKMLGVAATILYYMAICRWKGFYPLGALLLPVSRAIGAALLIGIPAYLLLPGRLNGLTSVIAAACLVGVAYCSACWVLGTFDPHERRTLLSAMRRLLPAKAANRPDIVV